MMRARKRCGGGGAIFEQLIKQDALIFDPAGDKMDNIFFAALHLSCNQHQPRRHDRATITGE